MNILASREPGKPVLRAVIDAPAPARLFSRHPRQEVAVKNKTRRRLGFVFIVLAVVFAALNLDRSTRAAMIGLPVVFLIVGTVLLRNSRSSTSD
jgi:hypothetical protein